ncbi:MAG TPA: glutaredoxin domain-containing protein [Anaeromyxobacter sp.]
MEPSDAPVILGFFADFSEASRKARPEFERLCAEHASVRAVLVDVARVKDVHRRFGVASVPTVVRVEGGRATRRAVGVQSAGALARALLDAPAPRSGGAAERPAGHRVTVFTTPTCSWCSRTKSYLRQNGIDFREVDVSKDEKAAQRMVARSGQMGVPQLDIDGRMIVGFDKARIDQLLGIARATA